MRPLWRNGGSSDFLLKYQIEKNCSTFSMSHPNQNKWCLQQRSSTLDCLSFIILNITMCAFSKLSVSTDTVYTITKRANPSHGWNFWKHIKLSVSYHNIYFSGVPIHTLLPLLLAPRKKGIFQRHIRFFVKSRAMLTRAISHIFHTGNLSPFSYRDSTS